MKRTELAEEAARLEARKALEATPSANGSKSNSPEPSTKNVAGTIDTTTSRTDSATPDVGADKRPASTDVEDSISQDDEKQSAALEVGTAFEITRDSFALKT